MKGSAPPQTVLDRVPSPQQDWAQLSLCAPTRDPLQVSVTDPDGSPKPHSENTSLRDPTGQGGLKSAVHPQDTPRKPLEAAASPAHVASQASQHQRDRGRPAGE